MLTDSKTEKLYDIIRNYANAVVSLSGGTDSVAVAHAAKMALGEKNVIATTAITDFLKESEIRMAKEAAQYIGIEYRAVRVYLMGTEKVIANNADRCYHCKKMILNAIDEEHKNLRFEVVFDGYNMDDENEYRPGKAAAEELGVVSPFKLAGFTKEDIREYMQKNGLKSFIQPSNSCLATRIKTGQMIDFKLIRKVCAAENYLMSLGYSHVRVRVNHRDALVQVAPEEVAELLMNEEEHISELKLIGFNDVSIDKDGYKRSVIKND